MNLTLLEKAIASRAHRFDSAHEGALRLFNGFYEGDPNLVVDIYARTLLIHNYGDDPAQNQDQILEVTKYLQTALNWLRARIVKTRNGRTQEEKCGRLVFGEKPDTKIKEHGAWYALNLTMNRDASFYLDTENLRKWLMDNMKGKTVLNAFAYTGSLGVAALKGGASRVIQVDVNRNFLNLAKQSYTLNGFPIQKGDFIPRDFFEQVGNMKREQKLFDCVIIDPPFFSSTSKGKVDQVNESARVINKVRPLILDGGILVTINNALFVSGREYMQTLENLCKDGYLKIRELIPVPDDFIGSATNPPVTDPAPFNHSTKIAVLDVRRK
jgi:23S rRNA (cytosine1962-C5)-methyltransferase